MLTSAPGPYSEPLRRHKYPTCNPPNSKAARGFYDQPKKHKFKINGIGVEAPNKKTAIKISNRLKRSNK